LTRFFSPDICFGGTDTCCTDIAVVSIERQELGLHFFPNFRSISCLPFFSKMFIKCVAYSFVCNLESISVTPPIESGFRKKAYWHSPGRVSSYVLYDIGSNQIR